MTGKGDKDAPLVLIVDDFEDNRVMYVEYLTFQGFRVAEAVNGEEAVAQAQKLLPAVVVMDLSLPVMDGWEATRRIKANPKTRHIAVIALTGHAESSHAKKARDAGCDDFVAKPCLPEALVERIRGHARNVMSAESAKSVPAERSSASSLAKDSKKTEKGKR